MKKDHMSKSELPTYQRFGNRVRINFDKSEHTVTSEDGSETTFYKYRFVDVYDTDDRDTRIEKIIGNKYPTYGAELNAINDGGDKHDDYQEFRTKAKELADGSFDE